MAVPEPEKPTKVTVEKDGVVTEIPQPLAESQHQTVTSPSAEHQKTADRIEENLVDILGIPKVDDKVITHPPEEKPMEKTAAIKEVGGEVIELLGNVIENTQYELFGSSPEI